MEDPVVPLERNLYGHPLAGLLWERQFEKFYWITFGKKFTIGNASSCTMRETYSCLCVWMTSNWLERTNDRSDVDSIQLKKPISFFDHVYLECTHRQCETSQDVVVKNRIMFESRISAGAQKNYQVWKLLRFPRFPTIWKVMPKSAWNDIVN